MPEQLDSAARAELLALARPVAELVARHLVMAGRLIDDDPALALEHAMAARRMASRIPAVREAAGLAAYHAGEWPTAIAELRTYHRITGRQTHLAVLADCERALGRPEKAVDLFRSAQRDKLGRDEALELLIVAAGARGDMGQHDAAATMLQIRELSVDSAEPWAARLRYAYADALLKAGREEEAREWFSRAAEVDEEGITDAAERLLEMDGIEITADTESYLDEAEGEAAEDGIRGGEDVVGGDEGSVISDGYSGEDDDDAEYEGPYGDIDDEDIDEDDDDEREAGDDDDTDDDDTDDGGYDGEDERVGEDDRDEDDRDEDDRDEDDRDEDDRDEDDRDEDDEDDGRGDIGERDGAGEQDGNGNRDDDGPEDGEEHFRPPGGEVSEHGREGEESGVEGQDHGHRSVRGEADGGRETGGAGKPE